MLEGEAIVRFRRLDGEDVIEYRVAGADIRVVDIPPGYTHSLQNIGARRTCDALLGQRDL